jgi:hypothetical protein
MRLVQTSLRCYPQRWRSRHGEEAAELASLLMRDGKPARSIPVVPIGASQRGKPRAQP